jgi:hypothetical protein
VDDGVGPVASSPETTAMGTIVARAPELDRRARNAGAADVGSAPVAAAQAVSSRASVAGTTGVAAPAAESAPAQSPRVQASAAGVRAEAATPAVTNKPSSGPVAVAERSAEPSAEPRPEPRMEARSEARSPSAPGRGEVVEKPVAAGSSDPSPDDASAGVAARAAGLPKPGRQMSRPLPPGSDVPPPRGTRGSIEDAVARAVGVPTALGTGADAAAGDLDDGQTNRAFAGQLVIDDGVVTLDTNLDERARRFWGVASLRARPIHLRSFGYPLVGVRVIASYLGRVSVIDGVLDVGSELANEVLTQLSREFRLQIVMRGGANVTRRDVEGTGLERNAALCLESARAALAATSYPRDAFTSAREKAAAVPVEERLAPAPVSLSPGDFRYLLSPREILRALDVIDAASERDVLASLLEVDGLPVVEFEAIRRRVLAAAVDAGLVAPRRFWRRITSGGLAAGAQEYVEKLTANRSALESKATKDGEGDDLDPEQRKQAWRLIFEFAQKKGIEPPPALLAALQLRKAPTRRPRGGPTGFSASGEIGGTRKVAVSVLAGLDDPDARLATSLASLEARKDVDTVIQSLAKFPSDELVALVPHLVELGSRVVPGVQKHLGGESRELRQLAAIVLGAVGDADAIAALVEFTLRERTAAWQDGARAVGNFGARALPKIVETLTKVGAKDLVRVERLARTLAEVALADDDEPIRALLERDNEAVQRAASRALATMEAVRVDGQRVRGELPLHDDGAIPSWACRLHEAISAPELAQIELEELDETGSDDTVQLSAGDLEVL